MKHHQQNSLRALLLSLAVLLSLPMLAEKVEIDGINYELVAETKQATVVEKVGEYAGEVVIPESVTHNGTTYSVTSIGDYAFRWCEKLTAITIPNSVTSIGNYAFPSCSSLSSVVIPNSVTSVGEYAFKECSGLTSVTLSNRMEEIGYGAFCDCSALTSVVIPDGVKVISGSAFLGCSALASVVIPNSVTDIRGESFVGCLSLTSITIPYGVKFIGSGAFRNCSALTSVIIPDKVTSIGQKTFAYCSALSSVSIGNSVKTIDREAFENCSVLASVSLGSSVNSIGFYAFAGCRLQTLICKPSVVPTLPNDNNVFGVNMFNHTQVYVPEGTYWDYAFTGWGYFVRIKEMVMDAEEIEPHKAYMIADAGGRNYTVYDSRKGKLVNVGFTHALDEESEGSCWTVRKEGNASHLYNIGAKKYGYVKEDGTLALSETPVSVDIANTEDGLSVNGKACMFVLNSKIAPNADGIDNVLPEGEKAGSAFFDLGGRRVQKVQKGLYIHNGRKVLVK